ncbi:adenylyltransferase/cytidyltransferase family protein [bacterium]|nr:adenylyltransferase/cytidyltransferase family protein [bacterium]
MRIGVFGGSFDPPHLGHTLACLWALETGEIDRVLLVPVARHAFGKSPGADFGQRMAMCRLAVAHLAPFVEISDIEGRREGTSFMIDTLRLLVAERPSDTFRLICGSDVVAELPKWRESAEVLRIAPVLELPRPRRGATVEENPGAIPPISSSHVRELLRTGAPLGTVLGKSVRDHIAANHLYRESTP